ncbi:MULTISPECIES: malto-oligosyltrehalose synthase [Halomonadaceae]|uniref:malto-oligosyltrehalose synthase n=1 Tax=Halomonadaceae TaxID=28256 RepID=UPI00159B60B2|nr:MULTISPECIES: malto-oligosyltrehalose synthase [Halomonas]QJQ95826.1 malto-oligosyltrehalose synthase [Halomonas sp. PA5]
MSEIRATVRLQFHRGFTLDDALQWVDYFAELGISHVYASPLLASRAGSPHGYDGIDPTRIDPELGGEEALERLVTKLRSREMGLILDIVPNHVAVGGSENRWWQDVLAWGRKSPFADFFDIDWHSPDPLLQGKLLMPFLGEPYGDLLRSGELALHFATETTSFHLDYHEHRFPLDPSSYGDILRHAEHGALREMAVGFDALASRSDAYTAVEETRQQLRQRLAEVPARDALAEALARFDGSDELGARRLHELLERQHYRLAWWRTASDEINWRRFFDITELGGLRVEVPEVFEATHALIFQLVEAGWVDGLRVDHVDGLADPAGYCRRLRQRLDALAEKRPPHVPRRVALYLEKILGTGEALHDDWHVDGTTGYEFMNEVSGLQHDPAGAEPLAALWRDVSGRDDDFLAEVRQARGEMLESALASEFDACGRALLAVARSELATRDITLGAIKRALRALVIHFPIYRTYADDGGRPTQDAAFFHQAMEEARRELNPPEVAVLDQLEKWLGGEAPIDCPATNARGLRRRAIVRFQQLTSPVAAKAVEDTAGYRSAVLISRNDVGFDPEHFSRSGQDFHTACLERRAHFPGTLLATATHDHKRGEDVRARLAVISEWSHRFSEHVRRWQEEASGLRQRLPSGTAPSPGDELILYQLMLGAWSPELDPDDRDAMQVFVERLGQWQLKALREGKLRSHWLWPDETYEAACRAYLEGVLADPALRADIAGAARALDLPGAVNGLSQTVLRLTVPGVPDLYQGTEFWDYSLVDPDNRREVDYAARQEALKACRMPEEALTHWRDGEVKQAVINRVLALRQASPALFESGDYVPLEMEGERANHLLAFTREHGSQALLVIVPRLTANLLDAALPRFATHCWQGTHVKVRASLQGSWRSVLTNVSLRLSEGELSPAELLADIPVGVFVRDDTPASEGRDELFDHKGELRDG